MTCPRCGRTQPPSGARRGAARYCVHCGRVLSGVRWVASPPDAFLPREPAPARPPYTGPPSYRVVPRWSLWPWAAPVPSDGPDGPASPPPAGTPAERVRATARLLRTLAWTTAILAVIAAVAEGWRYGLLVASRSEALSGPAVGASDVLVGLFGVLTPLFALVTGVVFLRWLLAAREEAARISSTVPSRSVRALLLGSVLPPATLTVPGAALAELEHAASDGAPDVRPRPSRPVAVWWAAWAVSVVAGLVTVVHDFGTSTQALADGVVLHALVDVLAAVTAVLTVRVVDHLTELLAPRLRAAGRSRVVAVAPVRAQGTPAPIQR